MSRRLALVGLLVVVGLLAAAPASAQAGWRIESFDVTVTVADDGTFHVVEDIAVDFGALERHGIFRVIPVRYALAEHDDPPEGFSRDEVWRTIDLRRIRVESTAPDDLEVTGPGLTGHTTTIRIGDEDVTVTGRQDYRISYEVRGGLTAFPSQAELNWNVTGHEWEAPIRRATVTVHGPDIVAATCFRGPPGSMSPCDDVAHGTIRATAAAAELAPGAGMTVVVGFSPDALAVPPPRIEPRWTLTRGLVGSRLAVPLTVLTAALSFLGVGALLYRQGRDRVTRGGVSVHGHVDPQPMRRGLVSPWPVTVGYRPPDDLRPAQLGLIVDERVDPVDVSATIVDLAVRGHLRIVEKRTRKLLRSRTDWTLERRNDAPDDLLGYERRLLDALFEGRGNTVDLSDLDGSFHTDYQKVASDIYADGVRHGWFPRSPERTRSTWFSIGVLAVAASVGLLILAVRSTTVGLAAVPLVLAAGVLLLAHRWMPHRTAKGSRTLVEALGFKEFIETAEADRMAFAEQENLFVRYLPYAVVFGATDKWARAFAGLGAAAATEAGVGTWYASSTGRPPDLSRLSGGLADFSARVGSSLPTAPASSGGSGGSGGGMGGGGGGSW